MANIKIKDIEDITLSDLFTVGKGTTHYDFYNVAMFVNFNYRLRPFIRVNTFSSKGSESRTFNYSENGLRKAKAFARSRLRIEK